MNTCDVVNWFRTLRTQTLKSEPVLETISVHEFLATNKTYYVHVWLIIEAEADIQRINRTRVGWRRHILLLGGVLFPKYTDGLSLFHKNNKIVVATYEKTFPLLRHQRPDSA